MYVNRILLLALLCLLFMPARADLTKEQQAGLVHLLKHDCGSCHGMTLKGGLGPSLLPQDLRSRDPEYLQHIISKGIIGTAMPPWEPLLQDDEINYLVNIILSPLPETGQ